MSRRLVSLLVILFLCLGMGLSACGKKAKPMAPEDADPQYPRKYPSS